ncbi:MAG TPA: S53 family peptidase [Streptosporangiaceae bacterium]
MSSRRQIRLLTAAAATIIALIAAGLLPIPAATALATARADATGTATAASYAAQRACAAPRPGTAACDALVRGTAGHRPISYATPSGYGPSQLRSAYKLPSSTAGGGQTVAIVDAYNDPNAASDLNTYRSTYGLPACYASTGCFRKVNQTGGTSYPSNNSGWALEESLDLDMVSAICPNCHIILVEASSASFSNLGAAENEAVTLGAKEISNSWGGSDAPDSIYGSYFNHSGIRITASSGDSGYGVEYPASSHYVTAVGGTTLKSASNTRGWTETAWSGAGSGCSAYNTALSAQANFNTGCSRRAVADVSADANPNTGVAVYDSTPYNGVSGWFVVGGTSVSSPVIASVFALAGNGSSITNNYPYNHYSSSTFYDITSGSNGTCSPGQLCTARVGWDGPTGLGSPHGTGGF